MTTNQTIGLVIAVIVIVAGALYLLKPHDEAMMHDDTMMGTSTEMMNDTSDSMTGTTTTSTTTVQIKVN